MPVAEALDNLQPIPTGQEPESWSEAFARPGQDLPRAAAIRPKISQEEQFHLTTGRLFGPEPGRKHFRLVQDERIAWLQEAWQVQERVVPYRSAPDVYDHQARGVAWLRRALGYEIFGKLVVELGSEHPSGGRRC